MIALIVEFMFFVGMLPILLFRVVMMAIYDWLYEFCDPMIFMTGVWTGLCGTSMLAVDEPDPARQFVTVTEQLVAISIGPVTLPYLFIIAAVGIMLTSIAMRFATVARRPSSQDLRI